MKFWTALILLWGGMAAADYPLMVFRQTTTPVTKAAFFKASCGVHAQFRGAFDEFWFAGGKPLCKIDVCRAELKKFGDAAQPLDRRHGRIHRADPQPARHESRSGRSPRGKPLDLKL